MRVLVSGDRHWTDELFVKKVVRQLKQIAADKGESLVIIQGGAPGVDILAKRAADKCLVERETYSADWAQYGKAAGPIRNQEMLDTGIDVVVGVHDDLENSSGTLDMLKKATTKGDIPVVLVYHSEDESKDYEWEWYGPEIEGFSL